MSPLSEESEARLRRSARDYITSCKEELAGYGLHVRSAMELEFMLEDSQGKPVERGLGLEPYPAGAVNRATFALRNIVGGIDARGRDFIERVDYEDSSGENDTRARPVARPYQYEVNIADPSRVYDPLKVAGVTDLVKERALKEMLLSSTCLSSSGLNALQPLQPNFQAFPYAEETVSSSLHGNISLWNSKGENLFADSPDLYTHCALSLAHIQNMAGIGFLPYESSLDRIRASTAAPKGVGISRVGQKLSHGDEYISVSMRSSNDPLKTRLENRLPGADADPFVVQALTLAAILDAVRKHVHKVNGKDDVRDPIATDKGLFAVDPAVRLEYQREIPGHALMVERLQNNRDLRTLLGSEFHQAILDAYGKDVASPAR